MKKFKFMILIVFLFTVILGNNMFAQIDADTEDVYDANVIEDIQPISANISDPNTDILDTSISDTVYKFSDYKDITLPFIRMTSDRMIIDKYVAKSGLSFARGTMNVENELKGIQTLISDSTVTIKGNMEYGVIIARDVIIEGRINKSLYIIATNVTIAKDAVVDEDILCMAEKINVEGCVYGNLLGVISEVDITGAIQGDLRVEANTINLSDNSQIHGNIFIKTYDDINIKDRYPNARVEILEKVNMVKTIDYIYIIKITIVFALVYLLLTLKTQKTKNVLKKVKAHPVFTVMAGLLSIVAIPVVFLLFILLLVFGLDIVAGVVLVGFIAFMVLAAMISVFVVGTVINEFIIQKFKMTSKFSIFGIALAVFGILSLLLKVPIISGMVAICIYVLSVGTLITTIFRKIEE